MTGDMKAAVVTEADRKLAANFAWANGQRNSVVSRYLSGANDTSLLVQWIAQGRFSRHTPPASAALPEREAMQRLREVAYGDSLANVYREEDDDDDWLAFRGDLRALVALSPTVSEDQSTSGEEASRG